MRWSLVLGLMLGALAPGCNDRRAVEPVTAPQGTAPWGVTGYVGKGPVDGALVTVRDIRPNGLPGAIVAGPFVTGHAGVWTANLDGLPPRPYLIMADGGRYTDEFNGDPVDVDAPMLGVLFPGESFAAVTPLTHAAVRRALDGYVPGYTPADALDLAFGEMTTAFGFDPARTQPSTPATAARADADARAYGALLGGVSALLHTDPVASALLHLGVSPHALTVAVAADAASGRLTGHDAAGAPVTVALGDGTPAQVAPMDYVGLKALTDAADAYVAAQPAFSGTAVSVVAMTELNPVYYEGRVCVMVLLPAHAADPVTGVCVEFPSPCDLPPGWEAC